MEKNKIYLGWAVALMFSAVLLSCSEDFINRPPKDQITDGSFYKTNDQILAATAPLYNMVWFDYNDKASYNLGDFRGGTAFSAWNDRANVEFATTPNTGENAASWRAFFNVVGQSNLAIRNIKAYSGSGVTPAIRNHGIAEARFMRALAYRFLVMNWGPVPIIENNLTLLTDTTIRPNTVESVWRFLTNEMRAVAEDLPDTPIQPGRVTRWSAEGMLARFYLVRAGVEATGPNGRNQQFLDSAKYYSRRVIELSGNELLPDYADLFKFPYDNNAESLFSLQWSYNGPDAWGTQNSTPAYLAYSGEIANGDGWGGDKGATMWMLGKYEGFIENGFTVDERLKATFMLPGFHYPEITQKLNTTGVEQELVYPFTGTDQNFVAIKKYVTGKAQDVGGQAAQQRYGHDTYMMRLAEMYLIYVEATLGNAASTLDQTALDYFNTIRNRAGLGDWTVEGGGADKSITFDDIFDARIVEFAMEGMAWYDLSALFYYNPDKAMTIVLGQHRGLFFTEPNQMPNPTSWEITDTSWFAVDYVTGTPGPAFEARFRLPIPAVESNAAPNLRKEPVDYFQ